MARAIDRKTMIDLIIEAKRIDPEIGSFAEWLAEYLVERLPTLTPQNEWVRVEERLPQKDGWYLVYAPGYWGNSKIYGLDGLAYSNFKHNYKVHWGIERGTGRGWPGIVTHWMPLPAPPDRRPPEGDENA